MSTFLQVTLVFAIRENDLASLCHLLGSLISGIWQSKL